jgi:D-alanine-D-alanine ligase
MIDGRSGFLAGGDILSVDCAIPCLHGDFGEDGVVQGALTAAHIRYVGQDVYASALTSDKSYSKLAATRLGIPTAKWVVSDGEDFQIAKLNAEKHLSYPLFIKPARLGSSCGAMPVPTPNDFEHAYSYAASFDKRVLIEELVNFDYEVECALFDNGKRKISAGGRILSGGKFYDFDSKYNAKSSPSTEAKSGAFPEIEKTISAYTNALADFMGIKHISRFDFFVTRDREIFFNEINAFPGMTATSLYPRLTEDMGFSKGEFINLIIESVCKNDRGV